MSDQKKVDYHIRQDERGACFVDEYDHETNQTLQVAVFMPEVRVVPVKGDHGPALANRDCAQIRAMIFATTMESLINTGKVDLG